MKILKDKDVKTKKLALLRYGLIQQTIQFTLLLLLYKIELLKCLLFVLWVLLTLLVIVLGILVAREHKNKELISEK
jgi:hypothetical protein